MADIHDTTTTTTPSPTAKGQITPVGAGIAGAIAGAALGAAAAVALSDEETRKKVQKNIKVFRDKMMKVMDTLEEVDEKDVTAQKIDDVKDAMQPEQPMTDTR